MQTLDHMPRLALLLVAFPLLQACASDEAPASENSSAVSGFPSEAADHAPRDRAASFGQLYKDKPTDSIAQFDPAAFQGKVRDWWNAMHRAGTAGEQSCLKSMRAYALDDDQYTYPLIQVDVLDRGHGTTATQVFAFTPQGEPLATAVKGAGELAWSDAPASIPSLLLCR